MLQHYYSSGKCKVNHNEIPLHFDFTTTRMAVGKKKWTKTNVNKDMELLEPSYIAERNVK